MKRFLPFFVFIAVLITGIFATFVVVNLSKIYKERSNETSECHITGKEHRVVFSNNSVKPPKIDAKLCDRLTIANQDSKLRLIAFGEYDEHSSYDGISEKFLDRGESLRVTLKRPGTFNFHDHLDENLVGEFVVTE